MMDLHLHSHRLAHRMPDWVAAAASGLVAGAILMVLELLWSVVPRGGNPWTVSHKIAAILLGPEVLRSGDFSLGVVGVALIVHYILGIAFGLILAAIIAPFHLDSSKGMTLSAGAAFGLLLYLFNFHILAAAFPWVADMRGWAALIAHLIFGMAAALMYAMLERPPLAR
jgi:hypothetical protein